MSVRFFTANPLIWQELMKEDCCCLRKRGWIQFASEFANGLTCFE